ncbi:MAG: EAL domain-containing protein [Campylobacterales bacterium]|nr:EAL domain-containing protein [Campylobacterales bacterium]
MESVLVLKEQTKDLTVLYIEDDEASRRQVSQVFSLLFANVVIAQDGEEGWNEYERVVYDIVFTDINMPKMNGIELAEKIKNKNPFQQVVLISAHNESEYLLPAIRVGVDGFIMKPIEVEQMKDVLRKLANMIEAKKIVSEYYTRLENEVKKKTNELQKLANIDTLTGLYNRHKFNNMVKVEDNKILLLLNIDNFDNINISYGYSSGDVILYNIANFLQLNSPPDVNVFRFGHDEFAFLWREGSLPEVQSFAEELQNKIATFPIKDGKISVRFTATIAIAQGGFDLLKNAHLALKEARLLGKNRIKTYDPDSRFESYQKEIQRHIPLLFDALNEDQITPYFHQIINNKTEEIEKYECLARIVGDNGHVILPAFFIKAAEVSGMLPSITRIMIEKSFLFFRDKPFSFSINISEPDLNDGYLIDFLKESAQKYAIDPNRVILEVLEGVSTYATESNLNQLNDLKLIGFQLAIDDFGTQNSNFERVHRLQVDYIKIDGTFIKFIDTDENSYKIAQSITNFAKSIGAKVIAEFVHSRAVYEKVLELDIDYTQGYYFGEPKSYC